MSNTNNHNDNEKWDIDIGLTKSIYHDNQHMVCMTNRYSNDSISVWVLNEEDEAWYTCESCQVKYVNSWPVDFNFKYLQRKRVTK